MSITEASSTNPLLYLNIHTHQPLAEDEVTVPSYGLHPWDVTAALDIPQAIQAAIIPHTSLPLEGGTGEGPGPEFYLIGECGLDRLCASPYDLQRSAFEAQIALSEQLQHPLILQCVHALDDVLRLKRGTRQPWIWHGFRGKPQQMQQLLAHGFYVSFGFRHNAESLRACPADRLFLETDDDPRPIRLLYAAAAALRDTTPEALTTQLQENLSRLMHKD